MESLGVYYWFVKMSRCGCVEHHVAPLAGCPDPLLFFKNAARGTGICENCLLYIRFQISTAQPLKFENG